MAGQQEGQEAPNINVNGRYGLLNKDLADKLESYEHEFFREDKPIPFHGLTIYPVPVRNFEIFSNCVSCFTLNKNEEAAGIRMSHLEYLVSKTEKKENNEGQIWSYKIQKLFELIFHIQNGLKCKKCGKILLYDGPEFTAFIKSLRDMIVKANTSGTSGDEKNGKKEEEKNEAKGEAPSLKCPSCGGTEFLEEIKIMQDPVTKKHYFSVDGQSIYKQDFDELRQIVLFQNFYDYSDDSWVDPEIKKDHEEKTRIEQKKNDVHATIEKKVVCLSISTHYSFSEIYDMSIRKFTLALATVDDLINYKITRQALMSGFASLPKGEKLEHWIYKPDKDMYGDSYKSVDQIKEDVSRL